MKYLDSNNYGNFPLKDDVNCSKSKISLYNLEQAFKNRHVIFKQFPEELRLEIFSYLLPEISFRNTLYTISNLPLPDHKNLTPTEIIVKNSCLDDFTNLDRPIIYIPFHNTIRPTYNS